jgi:beta-N-acetylhexosaminidase
MKTKSLSDNQLAGQRLMVGFVGTELNTDLRYLIRELHVGGIILFSRNVQSPEQLYALCASTQAFAKSCGQPPLFIAVDQEGGQVARLKAPFTEFPGNPNVTSVSDAEHFASVTAFELAGVGINMNLAPVLDVVPENFDGVMKGRAFGSDPEQAGLLGGTVIETLQQRNIMAVAKHFPGIGRTTVDSHKDLPFLDAKTESLMAYDLIPFVEAISRNVTGIMLSHICYRDLDPDWPASISYSIARELLRNTLGFSGLVLTDDLDMGAVNGRFSLEKIVTNVFKADIDLALICHTVSKMQQAYNLLLGLVTANENAREKAFKSVSRILNAKDRYLL